jgi:hypothetical protein
MSIDRIGKGGGAPPVAPPKTGAPRAGESSRPFEVRTDKPGPATAVRGAEPTPLARLRAGEVDVNGYLDLKVQEATSHLQGLRAEELSALRKMLRDQLATDPTLADLVQRATSTVPTPEE